MTGFVGLPGGGKTYGLAEVGWEAHRAGHQVWCNEGFDLSYSVAAGTVFSSFDEFLAIPRGTPEHPTVILWDELPVYVNSRKWQEFPDGMLYELTQIRKGRKRLYFSAMEEGMVDVTVRRLTFSWWHCNAITGRLLTRSLWPPERHRNAKTRPRHRRVLWVKGRIAQTYDTMGTVAAPVIVKGNERRKLRESTTWSKPVDGQLPELVVADGGGRGN